MDGPTIALGIFVIGHLLTTVWWASRVNTVLEIVQNELKEIVSELKVSRGIFVSKEELAYRVSASDKEHAALWKQLDAIKERA